ncbi:MAG: hypothetical protein JSW64_08360 [Candidatus Zixiibacteriota bacterium]|nr:MAG: hypothetical protein JSW64_08360 [candidate division Zixibacteria bacterium]
MMKRLIVSVVIILMAVPVYAKKKKTVEIKDNAITDLVNNWSMSFPDNWRAKSLKEPNCERVYLTKKNYSVNQYIQTYGGDYTIPTLSVFAQEFDGDVYAFEALLKRALDEHRSDNELISKMGILMDCDYITSGNVIVDSTRARQIYLKRNYKRVLDIRGETQYINDHEVHEIYLVKVDSMVYVIQAYCEREFYETNQEEFLAFVRSIDFK